MSGLLPKTPGDVGSDPNEPRTRRVYRQSPDECDRPSDDHRESGLLVDDRESAEMRPESEERSTEHESPVPNPDTDNEQPPYSDQTELEKSSPVVPATTDDAARTLPKINDHRENEKLGGGDGDNTRLRNAPTKKREPRSISGKRGQQSRNPASKPPQSPPSFRPGLICRKDPGTATWEVFLSADEQCPVAGVHVEGKVLDVTRGQYQVLSLNGRLTVSSPDEKNHVVPLFEGEPLIFKLRKNWSGKGRRISRITNGYFIVVAPNSWERIACAPVEPDPCAASGFRAHYFHRDVTSSDGVVDGFPEWGVASSNSVIRLSGREINDDSEDGQLFVGDYPNLECSPEIEWARVGEETERGWGQNFRPHEQSLPEALTGREGRFFLRVYDTEITLCDSVAFRYVRDLARIEVDGAEYAPGMLLMPTKSGYALTDVRFIGADGSIRTPVPLPHTNQSVASSGVIKVPPRPDADRLSCTLGSGSGAVNIVLDLPRIWWRLEVDQSGSGEWRDTPLVMTRDEFRKHAYAHATLSLLSTQQSTVRAGFDDEPTLKYDRKIEDECIKIPLEHFADHAQIARRLTADAHFNVERGGAIMSIIVVVADAVPEIVSFTARPPKIIAGESVTLQWVTRHADDARVDIYPEPGVVESNGMRTVCPIAKTRYTLTLAGSGADNIVRTVTVDCTPFPCGQTFARVMSAAGGWRRGKGFSIRELGEAGLSEREANNHSIPIDRRRSTSHPVNVDAIKNLFDA